MKLYAIITRKRNWTNAATRDQLGIRKGSNAVIVFGNSVERVEVRSCPGAASKVMRAVTTLTGQYGIGIDPYIARRLGIKPGEILEVYSEVEYEKNRQTTPRQLTTSTARASQPVQTEGKSGTPTLREVLTALKVGAETEVSESAIKSTVYSVAGKLGIKIKKVGPTMIRRIS